MKIEGLICFTVIAAASLAAQNAVLTNEMVREMVRAGTSEATVIAAIDNSETDFVLDSEHLIRLHAENVPKPVIRAMLRKGSGPTGRTGALAGAPGLVHRSEVMLRDAAGAEVALHRRLQNATFVKSDKADARAVIANLLLSDAGIALLTAGFAQQMAVWNPYMGETLARATQLGRGLLAGSKAETRGFEYETLAGATAPVAIRPGKLSMVIAAQAIVSAQQVTPVLLKLEPREKDGARIVASRQVVIRQVKQGRFDMTPAVERQEVAVHESAVALIVETLADGSLRIETNEDLAPGEYALVLRKPGSSGSPTSNVALPLSAAEIESLFSASGAGRSRLGALGGLGRMGMLGRTPMDTSDSTGNRPSSGFVAWDFRVAQ